MFEEVERMPNTLTFSFISSILVGSPSTSHLIENGSSIKKRTAGMSIKDILTQEYQKSKEVVSLEEELQEEVGSIRHSILISYVMI